MVLPWRLLTKRYLIISLQSCRIADWLQHFDVLICTDHLGRLAEPTRKGGGGVLFWNVDVFALFPLAVQYFEAIVQSVFNNLKHVYYLPLAYSCDISAAPSRICKPARRISSQESILTESTRYSRLWLGYKSKMKSYIIVNLHIWCSQGPGESCSRCWESGALLINPSKSGPGQVVVGTLVIILISMLMLFSDDHSGDDDFEKMYIIRI